MRQGLIPGVNVDKLDIAAGLRELAACGYGKESLLTQQVIMYCLQRWARGEEEAAQRRALDTTSYGIPLTCWYRVLAAAKAGAQAPAAPEASKTVESLAQLSLPGLVD